MAGAIVHEWISRTGGSEKVLDAMVGAFPDADVYSLWNDVPESRYPGRRVHETWLARTPLRRSKAAALPLMPATWRRLRGPRPDWVLASSHLFAHHADVARSQPEVPKFSYVYTPARYIWNVELDARGAGLLPRLASPALRRVDRRRAAEADHVAAISEFVRDRVRVAWERDADVIYPPVDVRRVQSVRDWAERVTPDEARVLAGLPGPFVLGASRFIPYKRLDLVIRAGEAAGLPVVLAGAGPEERALRALAQTASVPVTFVLDPSDELLFALYQAAGVFVFPAVEDFGIMPVEAMAAGTPVVVRAVGGACETVVDGVTGTHVVDPDDRSELAHAVADAMTRDPDACRVRARDFDGELFGAALRGWITPQPSAAQRGATP
ncbi:glycosyltransferase [Cellulomonas sp. NPDC055163]